MHPHADPLYAAVATFVRAAADAGYLVDSVALSRPDRPTPPAFPAVIVNGQMIRFQLPSAQHAYYLQPYYPHYLPQQHNVFWNTVLSPSDAPAAAPAAAKPPAAAAAAAAAKEFVCPRCHATFKTNSNMQKHVRTVHDNARPFKCDRCPAAYGHKNLLVEHVRTKHDGERPFQCDICGARFGRSSNLYSHMKSHDGNREHVCDTCHVSFSLHGNMVKHIKTVHLKQRPFECHVCSSRFGLRSDLTRHTRNVHGIVDAATGGKNASKQRTRTSSAATACTSTGTPGASTSAERKPPQTDANEEMRETDADTPDKE